MMTDNTLLVSSVAFPLLDDIDPSRLDASAQVA